MTGRIIVFVLLFIFMPFIFFGLLNLLKREFQKGKRAPSRKVADKNTIPPLTLEQKIKEWVKFGVRRSSRKVLIAVLYFLLIIILAVVQFFIEDIFKNILIVLSFSLLYFILLRIFTKEEYEREKKIINNFLALKRARMGLVENGSNVYTYKNEFNILEWDEKRTPKRVQIILPISFQKDNIFTFIAEMTERLGYNEIWKVSPEDGIDDENNTVVFIRQRALSEQQQMFIQNFLLFKQKSMGLVSNRSNKYMYETEFEILEWDSIEKPTKIRLKLPVGFDTLQIDSFLEKLSDQFGRGRPWEIDNDDKDFPGWNTDIGVATLVLQKELPKVAMLEERYFLNDTVQWSFFPLGIGSKNGIPLINPKTGEEERVIGFDVSGAQAKWCSKNGVYAGGDLLAAPHLLGAGVTGGGKSVSERNMILRCLVAPKRWLLFMVDLKRVEGALWRKYGVPVGTTFEDADFILTYAQQVMMERFATMEKLGITNWEDMPKENRGPAIMVVVDEAGELLAPIKDKTEQGQENAMHQGACSAAMESIARLGRAAQVHMIIFAQRPDAQTISMQIRQNCPVRLAAGSLPSTISGMVFESGFGTTVPSNPKGRIGLRVHSSPPAKAQGFFADENWLDKYLERHNLPTKIYESSEMVGIYEQNKEEAAAMGIDLENLQDFTEDDYELLKQAGIY